MIVKPLKGIKIIDLSTILMVPYCTRILADLGAEIIKIETLTGDNTRQIGPYRNKGMGAVFLNLNRNKKSISLDLQTKVGKQIIYKLVSKSDIFVSNIRKKSLLKLKLDHKTLVKHNKRIITAFAVGFSSKGPYKNLPAYDDIIQASSGMASYQEVYSNQPSYTSGATADKATGLMVATSIISGLFKREKDNKDLEIEVPMFETMIDFTLVEHLYGYNFDPPEGSPIYPRQSSVNRKPYKTKDGYIAVLPYNDKQWLRFLSLINKEPLLKTKKFSSLENRNNNIDELYALLVRELKKQNTEYWIYNLRKNDIPSMKVNKPEEIFTDKHLKQTKFFQKYNHSSEGNLMYPSFPIYFNNQTSNKNDLEAPRLGSHTKDILLDLGYSNNEIKNMINKNIVKSDEIREF